MTGFGVDGTRKEKEEDFEVVRGAFEQNPFVTAVKEHISTKRALGDELIGRMNRICNPKDKYKRSHSRGRLRG